MSRVFHLGERAKELDACAVAYWVELERRAALPSDDRAQATKRVQLAARRLLSAARSFGRAFHNRAAREAAGQLGPVVAICPGCKHPLPLTGVGRPRKYHAVACYNLARRLNR